MTFVEEIDPGTSTEAGGVLETRGSSAVYDVEMSDPRVSGTMTSSDVVTDGYGELRLVFAGMTELVNADGSWTGSWNGLFEPTMGWQLLYKLEGRGGFEGLVEAPAGVVVGGVLPHRAGVLQHEGAGLVGLAIGGLHASRVASRSCQPHAAGAHRIIPAKMDRNVPPVPSIW